MNSSLLLLVARPESKQGPAMQIHSPNSVLLLLLLLTFNLLNESLHLCSPFATLPSLTIPPTLLALLSLITITPPRSSGLSLIPILASIQDLLQHRLSTRTNDPL